MSQKLSTEQYQGGLSSNLVDHISQQIEQGEFKAGDKLPTEHSLAELHNVSRSVVREAFSQLQAKGLIFRRRGSGTYVNEPPQKTEHIISPELVKTTDDALKMVELRICLEGESAAMAAVNHTPEQLEQIRLENKLFLDAIRQGESDTLHDQRFHQLIAEATGNKYFLDVIKYLGEAIIPRSRLNKIEMSREAHSSLLLRLEQEHLDIYRAIERKDSDGARTAMKMHLINSRVRLQYLRAMEGESPLL